MTIMRILLIVAYPKHCGSENLSGKWERGRCVSYKSQVLNEPLLLNFKPTSMNNRTGLGQMI